MYIAPRLIFDKVKEHRPHLAFGEYALFADVPYTATLRAAEDSELLLLDEPTFDNLVAEYERMSHYVEQIGSGRLLASRRRMGVTAVIS